jgi:hypothetical protein
MIHSFRKKNMGNTSQSIAHRPGMASEFYWACRNGDAHKVTQMLPSMTYDEISALQPNGSTALHAASYNGHATIVRALIDRGCNRSTINRHGSTAYQEANNDEIRDLFKRPNSDRSRYMTTDVRDLFQVIPDENIENIPDNWVRGHATASEAKDAQFVVAVHRSSFFRKLVQKKIEAKSNTVLQELVEQQIIATNHQESPKANNLLKKFLHRGKHHVDHLIKLYTLETPFYGALRDDNSAFTSVMYLHLNEYRDRTFKGRSYRGASMTDNDIAAYKWAKENGSRVLETCIIQSTSVKEDVAKDFAQKYTKVDKHKVLFIFDFPEKCETAIALSQLNEKLRSLSDFEDEAEVLVLPYTLFKVTDMKIYQQTDWCHIFLTNVPVPDKSVRHAFLGMISDQTDEALNSVQ